MWATILGLFSSGIVKSIFSEITSLWSTYLTAKTDQEKAEALERIKTLQAVASEQSSEAGNKIVGWMRAIAAAPFIFMIWVYGPWDKVICPQLWAAAACGHDDLSPHLWYLALVVYGFLFLHWTVGSFFKQ